MGFPTTRLEALLCLSNLDRAKALDSLNDDLSVESMDGTYLDENFLKTPIKICFLKTLCLTQSIMDRIPFGYFPDRVGVVANIKVNNSDHDSNQDRIDLCHASGAEYNIAMQIIKLSPKEDLPRYAAVPVPAKALHEPRDTRNFFLKLFATALLKQGDAQ